MFSAPRACISTGYCAERNLHGHCGCVAYSRVCGIAFAGEEMEEITLPGFLSDVQTLFCGTLLGDYVVQVTQAAVNLLSCSTHAVMSSWKPSSLAGASADIRVTVATANATQARVILMSAMCVVRLCAVFVCVCVNVIRSTVESVLRCAVIHQCSCVCHTHCMQEKRSLQHCCAILLWCASVYLIGAAAECTFVSVNSSVCAGVSCVDVGPPGVAHCE